MASIENLEAIDPIIGTDVKPKAHPIRSLIVNLLKFGLTFGILYYLYTKGMLDLSRVKNVLSTPSVATAAIVLGFLTVLATVFRWSMLLKGQGMSVHLKEIIQLTMIGQFFNTALPGAVSGDVVKGYYIVRQQPAGRGRIKAFTTLLLDRVLGLSGLIVVCFVTMLLNLKALSASAGLKSLCGLISFLFVGIVVFYTLILVKWRLLDRLPALLRKLPAGDYFSRLYESLKTYENCSHYVLKGLAISIAIHSTVIITFLILARTLGGFEQVSNNAFFFLVPFGLLVTAVPIAPAGLGTGHAAFLGLFQLMGATAGADLFTAWVSFQILISLTGGLFYLKYRGHLPKSR